MSVYDVHRGHGYARIERHKVDILQRTDSTIVLLLRPQCLIIVICVTKSLEAVAV
jgi:hypothetical protein